MKEELEIERERERRDALLVLKRKWRLAGALYSQPINDRDRWDGRRAFSFQILGLMAVPHLLVLFPQTALSVSVIY